MLRVIHRILVSLDRYGIFCPAVTTRGWSVTHLVPVRLAAVVMVRFPLPMSFLHYRVPTTAQGCRYRECQLLGPVTAQAKLVVHLTVSAIVVRLRARWVRLLTCTCYLYAGGGAGEFRFELKCTTGWGRGGLWCGSLVSPMSATYGY
jgi:hypothetical protein